MPRIEAVERKPTERGRDDGRVPALFVERSASGDEAGRGAQHEVADDPCRWHRSSRREAREPVALRQVGAAVDVWVQQAREISRAHLPVAVHDKDHIDTGIER